MPCVHENVCGSLKNSRKEAFLKVLLFTLHQSSQIFSVVKYVIFLYDCSTFGLYPCCLNLSTYANYFSVWVTGLTIVYCDPH